MTAISTGAPVTAPGALAGPRQGVPYLLLLPGHRSGSSSSSPLPMVSLGSQSLQTGDVDDGYTMTWNFATYVDALSTYWPQLVRSLIYAGFATALALAARLPARVLHRARPGGGRTSSSCSSSRRSSPASSSGRWPGRRSWLTRPARAGRAQRLLHITDVLRARPHRQRPLLFSPFAVIMGLTYNFLPFMILPLYASLERLDPRLVEAAGDLYASPLQTFRKVTWPLSLPGRRRRHAADLHPRGGRLHQRRAARQHPDDDDRAGHRRPVPPRARLPAGGGAVVHPAPRSSWPWSSIYVRRAGTEELL